MKKVNQLGGNIQQKRLFPDPFSMEMGNFLLLFGAGDCKILMENKNGAAIDNQTEFILNCKD